MKQLSLKTFIKLWDSMFKMHPWVEAFCLSVLFHIFLLNFLYLCCQIHVMMFPQTDKQKVIEIEFQK